MLDVKKFTRQILARMRAAELARAQSVAEFVCQVADGHVKDEDEILTRLKEFGWTPEMLEAAVEALYERRRKQAFIAQEAALRQKLVTARAEFSKEQAAFEVTANRFKAKEETFNQLEISITTTLNQIDSEKVALRAGAPPVPKDNAQVVYRDAAILNRRIDWLKNMLSPLIGQFHDRNTDEMVANLVGQRAKLQGEINSLLAAGPFRGSPAEKRIEQLRAAFAPIARNEAAYLSELASLEKQQAELEVSVQEVNAMLVNA